jgi:hypothetical protein
MAPGATGGARAAIRGYHMRLLLTFSLAGLLLLAGCSSDDSSPTNPPTPDEEPLAAATIGPEGGVLTSEGFELVVPAGALEAAAQLELFAEETGSAFATGEAAPVFRIEGLPEARNADLVFRLAHSSATGDSLYALVGRTGYVPSLQETRRTWEVADCADSSGWALLHIPETDKPHDKNGAATMAVTIIRGVAETLTSDGKIKLFWSPLMAIDDEVADLKANLEEALALYEFMGFEQEGFTGWPIKAIIQPLDCFGYWAPNPDRLGGHLSFAVEYIDDPLEMRLTAGHELLHMCQYFYDPRTVWERGTFAGPLVWIEEATAVYIEDYFAFDDSYCSAARGGRELAPLDGILVAGSSHTMGEHGYGMSALIRYLAESEGDGFILETFQDIKAGQHAVAALQENTETDISDEWMEILEELITGNIYSDVTVAHVLNYAGGSFMHIYSAADSVASRTLRYPDLSGQTFILDYENSYEFAANQRLEFWCDAQEYGLSVFGCILPDTLDLLGHAYGKVTLSNLSFLQDRYAGLVLLVSNQRMQGPDYLGTTDITLESRLRRSELAPAYDHGKILIRYEADWSNGQHTMYQDMTFVEVPGTFSGNTFAASWDSTGTNGVHYAGHINVTLDPGDRHALSWSARNYSWMDDGTSSEFIASGGELPEVSATTTFLDTRIEGETTCGSIGGLSVTFINSEGETYRTLDGYTCNSGSFVKVLLYDRSDD